MMYRLGRWSKRHWGISITVFFLVIFSLILLFLYVDLTDVSVALIAITAPSAYYFYTEFLNRPVVIVDDKSGEISLDPEVYTLTWENPVNGSRGVQVVRPVGNLTLEVRNEGRFTGKNSMIKVRLEGAESATYYARWNEPEAESRYDLLPSEESEVTILRAVIVDDFFIDQTKESIENFPDYKTPDKSFTFTDGELWFPTYTNGEIRPLSEMPKYDVEDKYVDIRYPSMKKESAVPNAYAGELKSGTYSLSARIISDNYRSPWYEIGELELPDEFVSAGEQEAHWHDQWDVSELMRRIKKQTIDSI